MKYKLKQKVYNKIGIGLLIMLFGIILLFSIPWAMNFIGADKLTNKLSYIQQFEFVLLLSPYIITSLIIFWYGFSLMTQYQIEDKIIELEKVNKND